MKKFLSAFALCLVFCTSAVSEVDLSGMSYAELVSLKDQINLAMWQCQEWQEVTVPQGVWEVGVDIPAGHWTIAPVDGIWASVSYGSVLADNGKSLAISSDNFYCLIVSPNSRIFTAGADATQIDIKAKAGAYIIIENGDVVFTPYSGKPSLGFK